jgi:unsaturated chondroitin disaccharide hydrolase
LGEVPAKEETSVGTDAHDGWAQPGQAGARAFRRVWPRRRAMTLPTFLACLCSLLLAGPAGAEDPLDAQLRHASALAEGQLERAATLPVTAYPQKTSASGAWVTTNAAQWTSGFLPGSFWLAHQLSGAAAPRGWAESRQAGIAPQRTKTTTHDLGFMLFESFGNGYRLTGTPAFRQVALDAAASLATRYSPVVGAMRSWDTASDFRVIVDNMMNIELLIWGARNGGPAAWRDMAVNHALTTAANHVRADGSTYHVVDYDEQTGAVVRKLATQGAGTESSWARGASWAMHGFTMMYRETGDERFLEVARRTSDFFLANLPADHVPYWDFEAPGIPDEPRDSSAAAIAAAALTELARLDPDPDRQERYRTGADDILASLTGPGYLAEGTPSASMLLHGTYSKPNNDFDTGLIWGDYYLMQALLLRQLLPPRQPALPIAAARASSDDGNPAANAIDGDRSTRWSATGDGEWLELDLGVPVPVGKITLAFDHGNERAARFDVQTSNDAVTWMTRRTALSSATTLGPEAFDFADVTARYVRIVGHGTSVDAVNGITEATVRSGEAPDDVPPAVPAANPAPGTYTAPVAVSLASEPGAVIHYTIDGSEPTADSPVAGAPIQVTSSTTIRAFAVDEAGNRSDTASLAYVIAARPGLRYSASSTRGGSGALSGRVVSGNAYIFAIADEGITTVDFYLDGALRRSERTAPWDFADGTAAAARPFDTRTVADGSHSIRAVLHRASGGSVTVNATFTVANTASLMYSTAANRSSPRVLAGATVRGSVYAFVSPKVAVSRVAFYLDGVLRRTDTAAPWDFVGGSAATATAWNTATLTKGKHTVRAVVTRTAGGSATINSTFTVG